MYHIACLGALSSLLGLATAIQPVGSTSTLGKLPILGWNSWNAYNCDVDEDKILSAAQSFHDLGLKDAGYLFVNIDDCWSVKTGRDPTTNRLQPDTSKFPDGINGTAAKIHDMGLLTGIYSSAGTETCAGYPASIGYEDLDAETWNDWGIDYLKYDNCNVPQNWTDSCNSCDRDYPNAANGTCTGSSDGLPLCSAGYDYRTTLTARRYGDMQTALEKATSGTNRTIVYSLCEWGREDVWTWQNTAVSWRTTNDINPSWSRIMSILNQNSFITDYNGFWGHNDMDMLEVGNGNLTFEESRAHFALWAALKSPLLIGTNLQQLSSELVDVLKNSYLLDFHQDDVYGESAKPYKWGINPDWTFNASYPAEYYSGTSQNGTLVVMLNTLSTDEQKTASWSEIPGLDGSATYRVVDAWTDELVGCFANNVTTTVKSHDAAVYLVQSQGCS